ncbi:MAG: hypothetical protein WBG84_11760 [Psychrobacter nivimaris]
MIDYIAGIELKPGAFIVVLTVIRYTEGMGGKKSAAIPTETFMRVLGTNRPNTVYEHVKQAVRSGLVQVIKKSGCVNHYSVNQESDQWRKALVVAESGSSVGKRHRVVSESDTGVVSESDTLIKTIKENLKDNIKDSFNTEEKPNPTVKRAKSLNIPFDVFWKTYAKSVARDKCEAKWESLSNKVREQIMQHLPAYVASTPTKKFRKDPMTYLNRKGWLDDIIVDEPGINQQSQPSYSSMNVNAKYEDPDYDPLDGLSSRTGALHENY